MDLLLKVHCHGSYPKPHFIRISTSISKNFSLGTPGGSTVVEEN